MTEPAASAPLGRLRLDKWAFFVVLILGVAVVIAFDQLERPKVDAVVICVVLLVAYALAVTRLPALRLRYDQAADNCYYLGLLLTLTSLGVALFSFASVEGASESILRNFGVAIFTTIAGLGLRVLISQFREDPEDLEYEAREALAETVRRLRGELDQSLAEFQRFTDGARQALQETSEAARNSTADTLTTAVGRFEQALTETARSFDENAAGFNKRAKSINTSLEKVADAVETLTVRIASVRADSGLLQEGLQPAFDAMGAAVAGFTDSLDHQRQRLDASLATLGQFADVLANFNHSAGGLAQASTDLQASIAALRDGPAQFDRLGAAAQAAANASDALSRSLEAASSRAGDAAADSIRRLEQATVGLTERTATTLATVTEASARAADTMARLNTEFSTSGETVEKVRRELAELAAWIIERLDRA